MSEHLIRVLAESEAKKEESKLKKQAWDNRPTGFFSILSSGDYFKDREKWREGYLLGFENGYVKALMTLPTSKPVNLMDMTEKQKEFYEEFLKLATKYNCQIEFNPKMGMVVSDRDYLNEY